MKASVAHAVRLTCDNVVWLKSSMATKHTKTAMTHLFICQYAQKMHNLVLPDQYQAAEGRLILLRAYLE